MKIKPVYDVLDVVNKEFADPHKRELAALIAADAVNLTARAAAGEDVAALAKHLQAQSSALAATEVAIISDAVVSAFTKIVTTAIFAAT